MFEGNASDPSTAGLDWISALKSTDIRKLAKGPLTRDVPVPDAVAETASPDFSGERLLVCFNPRLRDEHRKRGELLRATEDGLDREAELDGIWVVRTNLDEDGIGADEAVAAYKSLSQVEQAFRQIKTGRLRIRPIFVYAEARVRTFLCMLACHAEWHMRKRLAPILFDEEDPEAARAQRASPAEPAKPSLSDRAKAASKSTPDATTVHSFHTLLANLSTVVLNDVSIGESESFKLAAAPTPPQRKAFDLLGVNPRSMFPKAGR